MLSKILTPRFAVGFGVLDGGGAIGFWAGGENGALQAADRRVADGGGGGAQRAGLGAFGVEATFADVGPVTGSDFAVDAVQV